MTGVRGAAALGHLDPVDRGPFCNQYRRTTTLTIVVVVVATTVLVTVRCRGQP